MKVLILSTDRNIFRQNSEVRKRMVSYAKAFDSLDIIVFTRGNAPAQQESLGVGVHAFPTNTRTKLGDELRAIRIALSKKVAKPDVVSAQDPFETGLVAWVIARLRSAKLHVQLHTDIFTPEYQTGFVNRIRLMIAAFVIPRADGIRVITDNLRIHIEKKYHPRAPISVLPIFVDVEKFKKATAGDVLEGKFARYSKKFLVVARFEKEKNVKLAIESFIQSAPYDAGLILLGEGSERAELEKMVRESTAVSRIFFEGFLDPAPYYALADVVLVPSLYEGYGMVIIEALAAGKPVIATNVGIARQAGAIVAKPEEFAEAIAEWSRFGHREAVLRNYPYANEEEYVKKITDDIAACAGIATK